MRAAALLGAAALALTLPAGARAGDRTHVPPQHRGDVRVGYEGGVQLFRLRDRPDPSLGWTVVGSGVDQEHRIVLGGRFTVWHGLAVALDLPIVPHAARGWTEADDMRWDPEFERATMVGGRPLDEATLDASRSARRRTGLGDMLLGLRFVPFAPEGLPGRQAPATLALDLAVRLPTGGNFDEVREDGTVGAGLGGPALVLGLTGARRSGSLEPYLGVDAVLTAPYRAQTLDADGAPVPSADGEEGIELDPADRVAISFGTEVIAREDRDLDESFRVGIGARVAYVGPGAVSSGTRIAAPLAPSVGRLAVVGEHVELGFDLAFRVRPKAPVELRIDVGLGWASPHPVEQVDKTDYTVQQAPESLRLDWGLGVDIRLR